MIELKRLRLINWHNFENVTFDCARLTYMIGVNAVGKTTILDAIRYCLTTNRNFNALGNKKSGRTLQGSVHAKQRGENAYRRPGHTVAYIGAEFWDSVKRTPFVIAVRVESEGPMQELHPGDQTWYLSEDGCTLEQLPSEIYQVWSPGWSSCMGPSDSTRTAMTKWVRLTLSQNSAPM